MSTILVKYENLVDWEQVAVPGTATQLISLLSNYSSNGYRDMQVAQFTNNDATNAIYFGWGSTVSSTKFWQKLAAGATFEEWMGRGALASLYVISAAGTPNLSVGIFA